LSCLRDFLFILPSYDVYLVEWSFVRFSRISTTLNELQHKGHPLFRVIVNFFHFILFIFCHGLLMFKVRQRYGFHSSAAVLVSSYLKGSVVTTIFLHCSSWLSNFATLFFFVHRWHGRCSGILKISCVCWWSANLPQIFLVTISSRMYLRQWTLVLLLAMIWVGVIMLMLSVERFMELMLGSGDKRMPFAVRMRLIVALVIPFFTYCDCVYFALDSY
jgi:hypothetical protein